MAQQQEDKGRKRPWENKERTADAPRDQVQNDDDSFVQREYVVGRNPVIELLGGERDVDTVYMAADLSGGSVGKIVAMAKERGIPLKRVSDSKLAALAGGAVHQGVAAAVSAHAYATLEDVFIKAAESPLFVVIADGIEDPHNLGAIIRTAEAAGAHGVIIPKRRSVSLTPVVAKAAAGALEHLPVVRVTNLVSVIEDLKSRGVWIYAADMDGTDYRATRMDGAAALVIGSEGRGLGRLVREKCDAVVSLPMYGVINSLNASVAAGVLLYEIARQRKEAR